MDLRHRVATVYMNIDVKVGADELNKIIHLVDDDKFENLLAPQQVMVKCFIYSDGTIEISGDLT